MGCYPSSILFTFHHLAFVSHDSFPYLSVGSHVTIYLLTPLPPLHLLLSGHVISQLISIEICSDIPSCICIQPLEDFLRGSRDCSFGFPKQQQSSLGYTCIQSLFLSFPLFRPNSNQDCSLVSTPLTFRLTIQLSLTASHI